MIQFVATTRRLLVAVIMFALLLGLAHAGAWAQGEPTPATPSPAGADTTSPAPVPVPAAPPAVAADTTAIAPAAAPVAAPAAATSAPAGKQAKSAKPPKPTKAEKQAQEQAAKQAKAQAKAEKSAKAAKAAPVAVAAKPPAKALEERRKEDGIYAKGTNWVTLRFGMANRSGDLTGDGFVGYGVGYQRMMTQKVAFAAQVGHDIVGHFGNQLDVSVPFTGEFQRHFKWNTSLRPFVGLGGGYYLRKFYRTASEYNTTTTGGAHVSFGMTSALDMNHVLGFEARVAWLQGRPGVVNPTFGPGEDVETIWTAKLSWGLVY